MNEGWPEHFKLVEPVKRLQKIGRAIFRMPHTLSSHGDNFTHPLDDVFDKPPYSNEALANMNQMYFDE